MGRQLQIRFLACLLVTVCVLGATVYFVHGFQQRRNARFLLEQAEKAEEHGDFDKAVAFYRRYLASSPSERGNALGKLGLLLAKPEVGTGRKTLTQAFLTLEEALRVAPAQKDVRREAVRLAMRLGRFSDALEHLRLLADGSEKNGELLALRGHCHVALRKFKQARDDFEEALACSPREMNTFLALAYLLRQNASAVIRSEKTTDEILEKSDATIEAMLKEQPNSFEAHLWAARFFSEVSDPIKREHYRGLSVKHIEVAAGLAPDDVEVILAIADLEKRRNQPDKARTELERGIGVHPEKWQLYRALATLEISEEKLDAALAALRRGLAKLPGQLDLEWNLAHLLTYRGLFGEARTVIVGLEKGGLGKTEVDYLKARIEAGEERWQSAARTLEAIYPAILGRTSQARDWLAISLAYECSLLLGQCYEQLGDPDSAASAYARAVTRHPESVPARLGLARMEWTLGRFDGAQREFDYLMQLPSSPAIAWRNCGHLLIARNAKKANPDWSEMERLLNEAAQRKPEPIDMGLLRAEMLVAQKQFDLARAVIESVPNENQTRTVDAWIGLAGIEQMRGNLQPALAILDEAESQLGDRWEIRHARCRYWLRRGGVEAPKELDRISRGLEKFKPEERRRIASVLAESYLHLGEFKRAEAMWQQIADRAPNDLSSRIALFDLAAQANEQPAMKQLVEAIRGIEGDEGTLWRYCQARQSIAAAFKSRDPQTLRGAEDLLFAVAKRRPSWGRVVVAQAHISDLLGDYDTAIDRYQKAVLLGEDAPAVIERAARLLGNRHRHAEVDELIDRLRAQKSGSLGEIERLGAESALSLRDPTRALAMALRAVSPDSKDYRDHIWLGRMQLAAGKDAAAESAFQLATKLAPEVPDAWVPLVSFLFGRGKKEEAEEVLKQAESRLPIDRSRLALAYCHELAGHRERCKELYEAALAANPSDSDAVTSMAFYSLRTGQSVEAKRHLEGLLRLKNISPAKLAETKRILALIMSSGNDYQETTKALRILGILDANADEVEPATGESAVDQRAKIVVLARAQNVRQRRLAIQLLEELLRKRQIQYDERVLLARLYESVGEWPKARDQYYYLLNTPPVGLDKEDAGRAARLRSYADQIAFLCAGLLRADGIAEAEPWLGKLEELEPKSWRTLTLRAQMLAKQGNTDRGVAELLRFETDHADQSGPTAALLEQLGDKKRAEDMYKKYQASSKKPESMLTLAQFYGRQHRVDEALTLCQQALKTCRLEHVTSTAVFVLYAARAGDHECQRVAGWIEEGIRQNKQTQLLMDLAAVRRLQKDYPRVIALHRQVVEREPNNTMALNNLAWLLALNERNSAEALKAITRAIELDGPQAEWLDTRAVVHLTAGEAAKALKDLEEVIAEKPTAHHYFHLAQAHYLAQNRSGATQAFQKALQLNLDEKVIDPLEQPALERLRSDLGLQTIAVR